jgi:hypothetical protein
VIPSGSTSSPGAPALDFPESSLRSSRSARSRSGDRRPALTPWRVFALFNHDLRQVFVAASDEPLAAIDGVCRRTAADIVDWEMARHRIERVPTVAEFPTLRHARLYAGWLAREGAFEGAESYAIGFDAPLQS